MSKTTIPTGGLADSAVTTAKITDANITTAKIADDAVTAAKSTIVGGLSEADFFVMESQYNSETSGNKTFTNEFVRATGDSAGRIGTGISLDTSNGKYTFTNTGIYLILVTVGAQVQTADNEAHFNLMVNGSDVNYIYVGLSEGS